MGTAGQLDTREWTSLRSNYGYTSQADTGWNQAISQPEQSGQLLGIVPKFRIEAESAEIEAIHPLPDGPRHSVGALP